MSVSRLIVTGVLDDVPDLKLLVAHAGAALPSLIGRLDSCVQHDIGNCSLSLLFQLKCSRILNFFLFLLRCVIIAFLSVGRLIINFFLLFFREAVSNRLKKEPSAYLKSNMFFDAISYSQPALNALIDTVGIDKIMFGA